MVGAEHSDADPMLKKIALDQLRPGMYVARLEGSWLRHPFWRGAFALDDPADIDKIRASGIAAVWIDTELGGDVAPEPPAAPAPEAQPEPAVVPESAPPSVPQVSLQAEWAQATRVYARSKTLVRAMFGEARLGRAIAAEHVREVVADISASLQRNPWAMISVARLKSADEYTYMHSVAVCALMMALARQLGLDDATTREAGLAGMLHDLGKARMPMDVLNKPGKLTDEEFAIVRTHPEKGWELLRQTGGFSDEVLDVCLHHHEKIDGSGYPHGLAGEALSLFARMGAVCDVYDAITSNRPYKAGWDPAESLRRMGSWKGHFDEDVFRAFVRSLGIYPIGSFVRLESGLMGVVIEQGERSLLTPRVRTFYSARSRGYVQPRVVDLAVAASRDRIVGPEDPAQWGVTNAAEYLVV